MARAFNTDIDTVVKFFIFILIFVFDPMAVSLVIAYNVVVRKENNLPSWSTKEKVVLEKPIDIYTAKIDLEEDVEEKEEIPVVRVKDTRLERGARPGR